MSLYAYPCLVKMDHVIIRVYVFLDRFDESVSGLNKQSDAHQSRTACSILPLCRHRTYSFANLIDCVRSFNAITSESNHYGLGGTI